MAALGEALTEVRRTLILEPGDLAFVDNRLALHGRTGFTPRYDGRDRWLQRIFVHRDFRRSWELRPGDGHVLASGI
jgi:L-asparagine oxygenase